jgi:AraC-like DNA-binding protein
MTSMNLFPFIASDTQATIFVLPFERLCCSSDDEKSLLLKHEPNRQNRLLIEQVKEILELHLIQNVGSIEIAATVGLSPWYLHRLFKRVTGCTLHQYVIERRIEKALQLIANGSQPLKDIAVKAGFADQSHLTRHFKKIVGMSPAEFVANYFGC